MPLRSLCLLAILMACGFVVVGQLYVTVPLVVDIAGRFGTTPANAALAGSAFGFAYAAGFLIFGPLSDRYGRRAILVLGLLALAVATVLVGLASSFGLLLLARAAQGLAASTFPPAALSLAAESLPPGQRPIGVSSMSFAFLGAAPLAQFFAVQSGEGLPEIMFDLAPFYGLGALALFWAAKPAAAAPAAPATPRGRDEGRRAFLFRDPGIVAAWAAAAVVLFGFVIFHAGVQALNGEIRVDLQTLRLVGLPPLLLTFAAAPVTRRHGAPFTARFGLLLAASSLGVATVGTPALVLSASVLLSAGTALAIPGLIAIVAGRATTANRGLALAVYSFSLFLGASIAPPVALGLAPFGIVPLGLLPAGLLAAGALGLKAARRTDPSPAT